MKRCDDHAPLVVGKRTLVSWIGTAVVLVSTWYSAAVVSAEQRPDVLMIAVDDLRPMLGCYGAENLKTPNLDRLARRSIVFERAYCQYAKCGTSRLSLMTGLRPDSIGVFSNRDADVKAFRRRKPDAISIAKWLKQQGYDARSFGKIDHDGWHVDEDWSVPPSPGRAREMWEIADSKDPNAPTIIAERYDCPAIQDPDVPDAHLFAGRMTREVITAMRERNRDQPMFFAVGYRRPHLPMVAPKRFFDLYQPDDSWLAPNPLPSEKAPVMAWFNSDGYVGSARRVGLTMPNPPNRREAIDWNGYELRSYLGIPNHGEIDRSTQLKLMHAYAACVSYVDSQIGLILDELQQSDRLKNTLIVFWSDHGWHLGEHSAWGKMTNFEVATRVPLMIAAPGFSPGRTRSLAELVDLYPTICELTEIPMPKHVEGESLVEAIRNPDIASQLSARSQYSRFGGKFVGHAIRTDRYRLVRWTETKSNQSVHLELYDHNSDPSETNNVASLPGNAELVADLIKRLDKE